MVAVPVNYGMLSYKDNDCLEVSLIVAVPVNYGMLSYLAGLSKAWRHDRRSPRQLWNALLHMY